MDLKLLDDVLVLLEEGNLTRAAARRNVTQPAFSRRIRGFEDWLGVEVLDRRANSVAISPALAANEPEIRALLARMSELRGKITQFDPAQSTVSIAAQHAAIHSTFPDMALHARRHFPALRFRLRPGNLGDCVTMFLRGDCAVLLCYESDEARPLPFGPTIRRELWGDDVLIPVIGGSLRYAVRDDGTIPMDTPAVVYPVNSFFGQVLQASGLAFSTPSLHATPVCETAYSTGIKELVLKGIGVGWLPFSMAHAEIASGAIVSLANQIGSKQLKIALYAETDDPAVQALLDSWSVVRR